MARHNEENIEIVNLVRNGDYVVHVFSHVTIAIDKS